MLNNRTLPFMILCLSLGVTSCGKNDSSAGRAQENYQQDQGHYRVVMTALNQNVAGNQARGTARIKITETDFGVELDMINAPRANHKQYIYALKECPGMEQDLNADGVLDVLEGLGDTTQILLPLDGDLSNRNGGSSFPTGSSYSYRQQAPLKTLTQNLQDGQAAESYLTLRPQEKLNLDGKTLVVLGVAPSTVLPLSAASWSGQSAQANLPIACGKIMRIISE